MAIPVVDIFAGPGGLGEGFSSFRGPKGQGFKIAVSAEMEEMAARTLRLRSFYRQFPDGDVPKSYYAYLSGKAPQPWTDTSKHQWDHAVHEAQKLTLGERQDDQLLYDRISKVAASGNPWVLIGGPPCQAYSLVGRARNMGIVGYKPEADHRHFLYKHYLHIINRFQPTAFIMENVKGILSSKVGGRYIFPQILEDLHRPGKGGRRYRILPLVEGDMPASLAGYSKEQFIVRSEDLGVPQARHRVILFGIAEDLPMPTRFLSSNESDQVSVADAISEMPRVRSALTDVSSVDWPTLAKQTLSETARAITAKQPRVADMLRSLAANSVDAVDPGIGGLRIARKTKSSNEKLPAHLKKWLLDPRLRVHLNHEARAHMRSDLMRYAYVSAFAQVHDRSPRGHLDFPEALAPDHANWSSGKFLDRFKVQMWNSPSSTITSHLSKDGHYFIHPDVSQIRSLTVREAARLQTFPDNYFFEGPRGAQFRQVGNAVPPLMARQIAEVVHAAINP